MMSNLTMATEWQKLDTELTPKKIFVSPTIRFYVKGYVRKDGKSQIYISFSISGRKKKIPTGLYIEKKDWVKRKQIAHARHGDINLILSNYKTRINNILVEYRLRNSHITLDKLVEEFKSGFSRINFIQFYQDQLDKDKSLKPGTRRREQAVLNKLEEWKAELYFRDITFETIESYANYLRTKKNNGENTVHTNIRTIKKYLKKAKKFNIDIPVDLEDINIKQFASERTNLTPTELEKCYNFYFTDYIDDSYKLALGYFLFSCFTGLRISDIKNLTREKLTDKFSIRVVKTERVLNISLCKKAVKIIKEDKRLFDDTFTPEHTNRILKKIMSALGIRKNVSMHVGRHTFAANYCRAGGQVVDLKNLLGHKTVKQTMEYAKIPYEESSKSVYILDNLF